jgi:long-subunit acyl-CoA synthetase (AMP-forming)
MSTPKTLTGQFERWATERANEPAIHGKDGSGAWQSYTWGEYWTASREVAKGLIALGHEAGQCVAIVGANRPEWVICQFGITLAGGIPAPSYPTNTVEQVRHILENSEASIAIADSKLLLDRWRQGAEARGRKLTKMVSMLDGLDEEAVTLDALRALGREQEDTELDARIEATDEKDVCLLIYTSGTTGVAKGVMLSQRNIVAMSDSLMKHLSPIYDHPEAYRSVSYLPLCHVAEQVLTNFMQMATGGQVYFCPELTQVKDCLAEVHPTNFAAVPRVWEKFQAALEAKLAAATGIKTKLAAWARKTEAAAVHEEIRTGRDVNTFSRRLANKLVISKVKNALGLDQLKFAGTAAAPISVGTLEFFASLGIVVHEAYGMSETTGLVTLNPPGQPRFGTVGTVLPGCEVEIADDGEIICRGANMTGGYLRMPDKTAELIDDDGWLHSGDLGSFDEDGFLSITGRKKDILITAGGKNVAPAQMEGYINQIPGVGQVVVVGDRQPYLCALITLDPENLNEVASAAGVTGDSLEVLAKNPKVSEYLQNRVEADCNSQVARYQTIKKIKVLPVEFSVDGNELTPTMKVKRNVVVEKYKDEITALYA